MAAKKFLIYLLSLPYLIMASIIIKLKVKSIIDDYEKCTTYIYCNSKKYNNISPVMIDILRLAEDHRQLLHRGIDPIAIIRTFYLRIFKNIHQGASTIEQQFVRTITKRYEKTIRRKIKEQILAILIRNVSTPDDICKCYLSCCYYGYGTYGIDNLLKKKQNISDFDIVAMIKYPFRGEVVSVTEERFKHRSLYLSTLYKLNAQRDMIFLRKYSG